MDLALGRFGDRRLEKGGRPAGAAGGPRRTRRPGATARRGSGRGDPLHAVPAQPVRDARGDAGDGLRAHRGGLRGAGCPGDPGHDGDAVAGRRRRQLPARDDRRRRGKRGGARGAGRAVPGTDRGRPGEPPGAVVRGPPERPLGGRHGTGGGVAGGGAGHGGGGPRGGHVRALRPPPGPCRPRGARPARPRARRGGQAGRGDRPGTLPRPGRARSARPARGGGAYRGARRSASAGSGSARRRSAARPAAEPISMAYVDLREETPPEGLHRR